MSTEAAPFLKWVGGKNQLLPEILRRLPDKVDHYYEPFVGGGAVFFALAREKRFRAATLNDANSRLVNTYRQVQTDVETVIEILHALESMYRAWNPQHRANMFYTERTRLNECLNDASPAQAARFIFLNKTCFNGLYRENKKGDFNVPWGKHENPAIPSPDMLRACSEALQGVHLVSRDFSGAVPSTDLDACAVYVDSPYFPVSKTADFTAYKAGGFGPKDQARLFVCAQAWQAMGARVLLSNADCPEARALYAGCKVEEVSARRNVNRDGSKRGKVGELLVTI